MQHASPKKIMFQFLPPISTACTTPSPTLRVATAPKKRPHFKMIWEVILMFYKENWRNLKEKVSKWGRNDWVNVDIWFWFVPHTPSWSQYEDERYLRWWRTYNTSGSSCLDLQALGSPKSTASLIKRPTVKNSAKKKKTEAFVVQPELS